MSEYSGWALSTIVLLAQREDLESDLRCQEIVDIINRRGTCYESFNIGRTPEEAVEEAVEEFHDNR